MQTDRKILAQKDIPNFRKFIQITLTLESPPDAVKAEYLRLWQMFKEYRGWACYEIGNVMLKLDTIYHAQTGENLSKYRKGTK